jgi:hypothetical protein
VQAPALHNPQTPPSTHPTWKWYLEHNGKPTETHINSFALLVLLQDLSLWLYSLCRLGIKPSPLWLNSYIEASFPQLPSFTHQELVNVMWAAAMLQWHPPLLYWREVMQQLEQRAPGFNAQDTATALYAGGEGCGWGVGFV